MYRIKNVRNTTVAKQKDLSPVFSKPLQKPSFRQRIVQNAVYKIKEKDSNKDIQSKFIDRNNTPLQQKNIKIASKHTGNYAGRIEVQIGSEKDQLSKHLIDKKVKICNKSNALKIGNKARIGDIRLRPLIKVSQQSSLAKQQLKSFIPSKKQQNHIQKEQAKKQQSKKNNGISENVSQIRQQKEFQQFAKNQIRLKMEEQREAKNQNLVSLKQLELQIQRQQQVAKQLKIIERKQELQRQKLKQEQLQEQIRIIKERRQKRHREKQQSLKKQYQKQQIQKQIQLQIQSGNGRIRGLVHLPQHLAHFQMQDLIMDAQVNKIIKTSFNHFPNGQTIETQKAELQRIHMSYMIVKEDPSNPLINGLKNFRTEIFNRIGMLIMEAQSQGYRNQNFSIVQADSRNPFPIKDVNITKGLSKKYVEEFAKQVTMENDDQCSICLNKIKKGQNGRILKCSHGFHTQCIDSWLQSNANCPSCRFNVKFGNRN